MRAMLFVLAAASIATAQAADLEGHWTGTWTKAGDSIAVAIDVAKSGNGYAAKIYPNAGHAFHIEPQAPPGGWPKRVPGHADALVAWAQAQR